MERHNGVEPDPEGAFVYYTDAQATIAALQARVDNLERQIANRGGLAEIDDARAKAGLHDQMTAQLTQRTAELEAANKLIYKKNCELGRAETINNDLQAELERVRADNKALDKWRADVTVSLQRPEGAFFVDVPQHIKDLVKERDELRTLIAALPKVEGEIVIDPKGNGTEAGRLYAYVSTQTESYYRLHAARFTENEHAEAYAALLKHRQGMEG